MAVDAKLSKSSEKVGGKKEEKSNKHKLIFTFEKKGSDNMQNTPTGFDQFF